MDSSQPLFLEFTLKQRNTPPVGLKTIEQQRMSKEIPCAVRTGNVEIYVYPIVFKHVHKESGKKVEIGAGNRKFSILENLITSSLLGLVQDLHHSVKANLVESAGTSKNRNKGKDKHVKDHQRCVEVLNLVEKTVNKNFLESKAERDLLAGHTII
ncbi:hypothetical protein Tco_0307892 [Tanacetum coccineum]